MELKTKLLPKQLRARKLLGDTKTNIIVYGGAAGGGKSYLIAIALRDLCLIYPGSRWLLGRARIKNLKESTLLTFFEVCRVAGLEKGNGYEYNSITGIITFYNGSEIYLKDLFHYPSDPHFDSLGSTEFCGAFIDEASQIDKMAFDTVRSRLRYKLDEFGIVPKIMIATNPTKNFIYGYYKQNKDGELPDNIAFIQALPTDNHHLPQEYLDTLLSLDKIQRERLYYGNREYDDNPLALVDYDSILDMRSNNVEKSDKTFLVCDVARFGKDKTVVTAWRGRDCVEMQTRASTSTQDTINLIEKMREKYGVPKSHSLVDEDGVGGGVVDIGGYKGFQGGSKAMEGNYQNLRTECIYKVSRRISSGNIRISFDEYKEQIIEEIEQWEAKDVGKDGKLKVQSKDYIKERIGRSPDFSDTIMMREWFELNKKDFFMYVI